MCIMSSSKTVCSKISKSRPPLVLFRRGLEEYQRVHYQRQLFMRVASDTENEEKKKKAKNNLVVLRFSVSLLLCCCFVVA